MKKFNKLYNKIISESYDWDAVRPVFEKEEQQLVDKVNDYFKKRGLECYFTLMPRLYFSDGYRKKLKFNAVGDKKGREWWEWTRNIEGMETKNLIVKNESDTTICLKSTWRPESHRGQIPNWSAAIDQKYGIK